MVKRLEFKEDIVSTAVKPVSTKELLLRLNILHSELAKFEQDNIDLTSLESIKDELINKKLLKNSNKGIQIYVSCCLADILRLYAPDAPYNDTTLTNIFKLFIQQFNDLANKESPYYPNYVYLLERIAEVKLVALMTDLSNKDKLINEIFEIFYSLINKKSFDVDSLQNLIVDILNEVISEVNHLDLKVLKLILNKFLANSKNLKNQSNVKVPGFEISLALCEINSDKLSRLVTYFFSEMILEATKNVESDIEIDTDSDDDDDNQDIKKLAKIDLVQMKKIHNLAIELWRYVPEILTSVLGLLDNELEADDFRIRMIATDTVSQILAIHPSRINFPIKYVETYMNWLKKPLDISIDIRICWINGLSNILGNRTDINTDLTTGLLKTLIDSNEKVRLCTIVEMSKLKPATFLNNILNDTLADTLFKLLREKNQTIRNEMIKFLAAIYNYSADSDQFIEDEFVNKIPDNILNLVYINDNSINSEIDTVLFEKIIPFNSTPLIRVKRLLLVLSKLSEKSKSAFFAMSKRQTQLSKVILQLLELVEDRIDIEMDNQVNSAIKWISEGFPISYNLEFCLQSFIRLNNKRFFRLMKLCATETSDYDTIVNSMKELLNRINDPKTFNNLADSSNINLALMYNNFKLLLLRISNIFYNTSNISDLMDINSDQSNRFNETSKLILNNISTVCPNVLASNVFTLLNDIANRIETINFDESRMSNDLWKDLKIAYNYFHNNYTNIDIDNELYDSLYELSINGSPLEAKYSMKILNNAPNDIRGRLFTKIVHKIWPLNRDSILFNTHLSVLCELFLYDMVSVDHIKDDLSRYLASEILLKNSTREEDDDEEEDKENFIIEGEKSIDEQNSWIDDEKLYYDVKNKECLSKILAMKLLTNWLIAIKDDSTDIVELTCKPVLSMLSSFINRGGEIVSTEDTPLRFCARLRLHAGIQLLKISQMPTYEKFIDQRRISRLILLIQDIEYQVRFKFLNKLKKRLTQHKISERFLPLIFFTAHEPDAKLRTNTSTWIKASFQKQCSGLNNKNPLSFEKAYTRLLYMLSNHPEFRELYITYKSINVDNDKTIVNGNVNIEDDTVLKFKEMVDFALTYIVFSLSLIIKSENVSLLYYLSQRIKQFEGNVMTAGMEDSNDSLYLVAELSQTAVENIGKVRNWNISIWPGTLNLPFDLFTKLDNETANKILKTNFIPDELSSVVDEIIREKWKNELGFSSNKKSKSKINRDKLVDQPVMNSLNSKGNIEGPKKKISKRKRSRIVDSGVEDSNDESDYEVPKTSKSVITTGQRKSRRGKRINYNEENY